jgi:hypothetical protein
MHCLYIILHTGIIGFVIFPKPGLEPRLWAFSCCKPSPSPIQAQQWAGLGLNGLGLGRLWALGFGPGPAHHYLREAAPELMKNEDVSASQLSRVHFWTYHGIYLMLRRQIYRRRRSIIFIVPIAMSRWLPLKSWSTSWTSRAHAD